MGEQPMRRSPSGASAEPADGPVRCSVCSVTVEAPPLTWSASAGPLGTRWACEACTRTHLRAMEAKLDEAHW